MLSQFHLSLALNETFANGIKIIFWKIVHDKLHALSKWQTKLNCQKRVGLFMYRETMLLELGKLFVDNHLG